MNKKDDKQTVFMVHCIRSVTVFDDLVLFKRDNKYRILDFSIWEPEICFLLVNDQGKSQWIHDFEIKNHFRKLY